MLAVQQKTNPSPLPIHVGSSERLQQQTIDNMTLNTPFIISSRLMAALQIGNATLSGEITGETNSGRLKYRFYLDTPDFEYVSTDLRSGCGNGSLQCGFESMLSFMGAAAEAYRYGMSGRTSDNADLFPANVMEWCYQHSDEISILECELQENGELIND